MDFTLLTAVHPRRTEPVKMNARQEQEYYDRAAGSLALLMNLPGVISRARSLGSAFLALIQTTLGNFGHGMTARKALH